MNESNDVTTAWRLLRACARLRARASDARLIRKLTQTQGNSCAFHAWRAAAHSSAYTLYVKITASDGLRMVLQEPGDEICAASAKRCIYHEMCDLKELRNYP
jgi:hypothetical protein